MTQTIDEQLSALLDGELPIAEADLLLHRLEQDQNLRQRMGRYALIGDVLTDATTHAGALTLSERVRESLAAEMSADHGSARPPFSVEGRKGAVGSGLIGAGLAAAAALVVALNLTPVDDAARDSRFAAGGPSLIDANTNRIAATLSEHEHEHKANVAPARMTRYLVSHAEYSNAASRQFVDSHLVMPSFRGPSWQSQRSIE